MDEIREDYILTAGNLLLAPPNGLQFRLGWAIGRFINSGYGDDAGGCCEAQAIAAFYASSPLHPGRND